MNADELMIGDWVQPCSRSYPVQVESLSADTINGDMDATFDPIPLTPEILEKNGFDFGYTSSEEEFCTATGCGYPEDKGWCYDEGAGEIKIIFPNETDGGLIRLDDQCFDRHLELIFCEPIMVHKLQHCLKLVGIDKEIVL